MDSTLVSSKWSHSGSEEELTLTSNDAWSGIGDFILVEIVDSFEDVKLQPPIKFDEETDFSFIVCCDLNDLVPSSNKNKMTTYFKKFNPWEP